PRRAPPGYAGHSRPSRRESARAISGLGSTASGRSGRLNRALAAAFCSSLGPNGNATMRVAIIYDCLFPWTIGGAERWYRNLAEKLAEAGHKVTYLTLRQWDERDTPRLRGVNVVAVGPRLNLYSGGKRRIWPALRFGLGVFVHLLRHGS